MDLSTVEKNIKDNEYSNKEQVFEDLNLIWKNCKIYNLENSQIYRSAVEMEKKTKILIEEMNENNKKFLSSDVIRSASIAPNSNQMNDESEDLVRSAFTANSIKSGNKLIDKSSNSKIESPSYSNINQIGSAYDDGSKDSENE
jgi:hypothetical protein